MRRSFVLPITFFLLACDFAHAQDVDPNEVNRRFENLRVIQRFGGSYITMRETLFSPMPSEVHAYSNLPKQARSHFEKGNAAMQRGENGKAKEEYESAIAQYPDFALAHHNLAVAAMNLKEPQRARDEFQAAVKIDPQMAAAHQNLGVLEIQQQNLAAAQGPLETANRLNPLDLKTLTLLAYCQALTGQLEKAVLTARRVHDFKQHAGYAYAHMIAATALQSSGKLNEAIQEYRQFLAEDPDDPRVAAAKQQLQKLQVESH
ncbi:MAG TPA: tetratricopeptide repeat protein [Terriglobales bacterium]|nr:tetratricopeptide repeat protein [Terriglobales bacterium]